jgi:hypothetical protein
VGDHAGQFRGQDDGDERMLAALPDFLCLDALMKATPAEEGGERIIYIQASDETTDAQGEKVLCKALQDSADTFLRYGSLDIDHIVLMGPKSGLPNFMEYEIGRPIDVGFSEGRTFVKAQLYRGDGALARNANMVWESMTRLTPPARWYPSVGGASGPKRIEIDPLTKARTPVIDTVRWTNLALSRTPVNQSVPVASHIPVGVFAKSLGGFVIHKSEGAVPALVAGYGTDVATLSGGGALRGQSLAGRISNYWQFSERLAGDLRKGACGTSEAAIAHHATRAYGIGHLQACAWGSRFLADLTEATQDFS